MTPPRVDPPGTTQFCPICEHNAPKVARLLKMLKVLVAGADIFQIKKGPGYTRLLEVSKKLLKEWQPEKRGE